MKLLTNPLVVRMAVVFLAGACAFVLGAVLIRRMRRSLMAEGVLREANASPEAFPQYTYQAVIQELKQQKHELQSEQQAERRRAKTSENISAAVLSNLSSGVLFVGLNGLVRQANAAARQILGFGALAGMGVREVFREAVVIPSFDSRIPVATVLETSLQEKTPYRRIEARYVTPGGEERNLELTATSVKAPSGDVLGVACLISDQTELKRIRHEEQLRGEISAEMALELRSSLIIIADCARQLASDQDPETAHKLAADIATETELLQNSIGGFLSGAKTESAAAGV